MRKKLISIIVPCFNEEANILNLYQRTKNIFKKLPQYSFEILFIDNNSTDKSKDILIKLAKKYYQVKVILMSRNFGSSQPSYLAGLRNAKGLVSILLHGDIQDPPELIPKFLDKWNQGYSVVYGIRTSRRGYNIFWNIFYKAFYMLLNKIAYINIPLNAGDFSLLDKNVIKQLLSIDEYDYYIRCLRAFVGYKQIGIPYIRDARTGGKSTETFLSSFWWAKTILVNFSFKPLEWISVIGIIITVFSFFLIIFNLFLVLLYHNSPRGIPTIVILILFLGGIQILSISIIAEYLAKIFLEVKHRPKYIIEKKYNL